ncbi:2-amino-4-hydroxy-6-hydroxymethyldihydropteridine diphosphokinase [Orenia marismortui]|uniref:2-amino-4-hydroxy-6-hydroxymethyldihydropteridine diphosphokinase n=1 Tax=Orenia marismortui TaxID=46469 RepID=A0A4R8GV36_9FIRM|nr:2-amino-4-hydroxy-6-hydroxymethyldihydropteridine diphosphokinase [Orenia marismortui]TDX48801.1 2-amino-4-hydroxy-6-hydroxymethyldihydropteridine diphosphokinase [Orenia marismortui]
MINSYLGLGTNVGDREDNLRQAISLIKDFPQTKVLLLSKIYETEPWGYTEQDNFLNMCLKLETTLSPYQLLAECQAVEKELKRKRKVRWGPRTIDVDILLYDNLNLSEEDLTIPHPRIAERNFVLIPLRDLDKKLTISNKKIDELINNNTNAGVKLYRESIFEDFTNM